MNELLEELKSCEVAEDHFSAIHILKKIEAVNPDEPKWLFERGIKHLKIGEVEEAEHLFRKCIEVNFENPLVHLNLGHTLLY